MKSPDWSKQRSGAESRPAKIRCQNGHIVASMPAGVSVPLGSQTRRWQCGKCGVAVRLPLGATDVRV